MSYKADIYPWQYILFTGMALVFTLVGLRVGLFWDNVLFVGKTGTWLYNNGIFNWFEIPISGHSPHPYLCGTYYAIIWQLFGRSLLVSHLATIPIIWGVLYQLWNLCTYFTTSIKQHYAAFLLACACPCLCSHCVQIGQELFILFFALYALNAILRQEYIHKGIALCFLPLFSFRAMMLCAGLFITEWALCIVRSQRFWTPRIILSYAGGTIISCLYLMLRYALFFPTPSTTNPEFFGYFNYESISQILYTFARNGIVLIWEFLDFGQISLFIVGIVLIIHNKDNIMLQNLRFKELMICAFFPCSVIVSISLFTLNPFGHHYFLLSFLLFIIAFFYLLQLSKQRKWIYLFILFSLLAGNLIVYPEYKAQGWQNSLAHLPYWELRRKAINEMDQRHIPIEQTASFFPHVCEIDLVELNGDHRSFCTFTGNEKYVLYSSCFNPLDEEIDVLHQKYEPLYTYSKGLVYVQLWQRREESNP